MLVKSVAETPDYFVVTTTSDINSGRTSTVMERATAPMGRALEKYFGKFADEQTGEVLGMAAMASDELTTGIGVTGQVMDDQTGKPVKEFYVEWNVADPEPPGPWWVLQPDGWWVKPDNSDVYYGGRFGSQFIMSDDSRFAGWNRLEYYQAGESRSFSQVLWKEGQKVWPKIRADGYLTEPVTPEPVLWPVKLTNVIVRLKRTAPSPQPATNNPAPPFPNPPASTAPSADRRSASSAIAPPRGATAEIRNPQFLSGRVVDDATGEPIGDFAVQCGFPDRDKPGELSWMPWLPISRSNLQNSGVFSGVQRPPDQ
jgi:hypothetical protein